MARSPAGLSPSLPAVGLTGLVEIRITDQGPDQGEDPGSPAHLEIEYPGQLSRGLALVKWWLLAIPHYIIVGLFTGGGLWFAGQYGEQQHSWAGLGLIGILAVIAAVILLVTGRYPEQIFNFVLGLNRWVLRVAGYAGLHLATGAAADLIGTVRIRVTQASGTAPAFVGIAPASAAARYLAGVDYATVRGAAGHHGTYAEHAGSAPTFPPGQAGIWTAHAAGPGTQTMTWAIRSGDWMVVAMNADGSRPVNLQVNVAATLPALPWIAAGLLIGGIIFLTGGVLLIAVPLRRASGR
ncbi:MAG TPA: DUF4389 domain-containing protein [Streptosporangiaceae bacterium]|nr:DUF4389 domain-containing protein [Streptosporangiaceae bacterium]